MNDILLIVSFWHIHVVFIARSREANLAARELKVS